MSRLALTIYFSSKLLFFFISKISLKEKRGQIQVHKLYTLEMSILQGEIKWDELSNALFCWADFWGGWKRE
jgi:hypothetical protein